MQNNLFFFFHNLANQSIFLDKVIFFIAEVLPYFVVLGAIIFLFFHHEKLLHGKPFAALREKWHEGTRAFMTGIFAWLLASLLKFLFQFSRPFDTIHLSESLWLADGYAFPSGHATFFMALAVSIFFHHKKIGSVFILITLLVGVARIVAGVHFPMDILAGFILGALVATVVEFAKHGKRV